MENLDQESKSHSQQEIFIFSEPRFPTGRNCLEEGKFTVSYFFMEIFSANQWIIPCTECSFHLKDTTDFTSSKSSTETLNSIPF